MARTSAKKRSRAPRKAARSSKRPAAKPIDLYYWPTPNGYKVSIMLEECGLPYASSRSTSPAAISSSRSFWRSRPTIACRRSSIRRARRSSDLGVRVRRDPAILGRKTGRFYPATERARVEVDQWLFWQMANLGPKAGECHHFRLYAPERATLQYAVDRFTNECNRLYGVMNRRLADRDFLAGGYSIADMACIGWASRWQRQGQDINGFPHLKRWLDRVLARRAVYKGMHIWVEAASKVRHRRCGHPRDVVRPARALGRVLINAPRPLYPPPERSGHSATAGPR